YSLGSSRATVNMVTGSFEFASRSDGLGRSIINASDCTCTTGFLGNGSWSLQERLLDWNGAVCIRWTTSVVVALECCVADAGCGWGTPWRGRPAAFQQYLSTSRATR